MLCCGDNVAPSGGSGLFMGLLCPAMIRDILLLVTSSQICLCTTLRYFQTASKYFFQFPSTLIRPQHNRLIDIYILSKLKSNIHLKVYLTFLCENVIVAIFSKFDQNCFNIFPPPVAKMMLMYILN